MLVELEKLIRKKNAMWILFSIFVFQIAATLINYNIKADTILTPTGFQLYAFSIKTTLQILALIFMLLASITLAEEVTSGTVNLVLSRGVKRFEFIVGKFLSLFFISITVIVLVHILGLFLCSVLAGLGPLMEGEYLVFSSKKLFTNFGISLLLTIPPLIALISFGIFISAIVKESGWSVGTGIIALFLLQILSQFEQVQRYLFSYYLFLPVNNITRLTQGIFIDWADDVYWLFGVSSGYILIFIGLSISLFNKRDL